MRVSVVRCGVAGISDELLHRLDWHAVLLTDMVCGLYYGLEGCIGCVVLRVRVAIWVRLLGLLLLKLSLVPV